MTRRLRWLTVLPVLFALACVAYVAGGSDAILFPHGVHQRAKIDCLVCHEEIYDAKTLQGNFLPKEKKCLECHEEKKQQGQCDFCHKDPRHPGSYRKKEPTLKIGHAGHIELVKEDCSRCHTSLPEPGRPVAAPTMAGCLGCHAHKQEYKNGQCQACHTDLSHYPIKPVSLFSHQGDYVHVHGREARASQTACATCHEQTFCADCHASTVPTRIEIKMPEKTDSDFIHRDDFLGRHSIEASGDPASCQRCHGQSFCQNCHARQNLTTDGVNPHDPHPPGWSVSGSPQFHGTEARHDINRCASCHDQGPRTNCIGCHRVGGVGGNPHPADWLGHHDAQEIHKNSMCVYCHN